MRGDFAANPPAMGGLGGLREVCSGRAREGQPKGEVRQWEGWEGFGTFFRFMCVRVRARARMSLISS
jgi:hypothetical protein